MDSNGDGVLDAEELYVAMRRCGSIVARSEFVSLVNEFDLNGDGVICRDEWANMISSLCEVGGGAINEARLAVPNGEIAPDIENGQALLAMSKRKIAPKNEGESNCVSVKKSAGRVGERKKKESYANFMGYLDELTDM